MKINRKKLESILKGKQFNFSEIGKQFGICRERVRQVAAELDPSITGKQRINDLESVKKRLLKKVKVDGITNCWIWIGAAIPLGYGRFSWKPCGGYAHRAAYMLFKGKIPSGKELDHLCRVPSCVNPDHLEAVTHKVNTYRSPIHNANKTHCPQGHPLSGRNLGRNSTNGSRFCRTCARTRDLRKYWTKRRSGCRVEVGS